jgi:hypothetical protein
MMPFEPTSGRDDGPVVTATANLHQRRTISAALRAAPLAAQVASGYRDPGGQIRKGGAGRVKLRRRSWVRRLRRVVAGPRRPYPGQVGTSRALYK